MSEARELKRARQACSNCRRKKVRCSGERPACAFCIHLKQECSYQDTASTGRVPGQNNSLTTSPTNSLNFNNLESMQQHNANLAARVAMLESRLNSTYANASNPSVSSDENLDSNANLAQSNDRVFTTNGVTPGILSGVVGPPSKFAVVPPLQALRNAADVYFSSCHNQPYCYFHEPTFRQNIEEGKLPDYLVMIFMATAARYSSDEFFEGRQFEAMETYCKTAWRDILKHAFSSEVSLDLHMVQATNLLAVIEFTAGRHRLGWVKIGLSVRFAQGLRLNAEPDPNMSIWQQEEHRRVFWSVYMLDKLVSCCRNRPPTILDMDCSVKLPCSEEDFRAGNVVNMPSLEMLEKLPDTTPYKGLDHFAYTILTACILGRVTRHSLQQNVNMIYPHWDSRSDFAKIYSMLLSFEGIMTAGDENLTRLICGAFNAHSEFDRQRAGHIIWSRGYFHLSHCLLHHPLLLRRFLRRYQEDCPRSFLVEALRRCHEHAEAITMLLRTVEETDCCAHGSFLGYFAVVAGTIHRLNQHSKDDVTRALATRSSQVCVQFLESKPVRWDNYPRMAAALKSFAVNPQSAQALIEPTTLLNDDEMVDLDNLWCLLDYGWLSDGSRSTDMQDPLVNMEFSGWGIFEDLFADQFLIPGLADIH